MSGSIFRKDWHLSTVLVFVFLVLYFSGSSLLQNVERIGYDAGVRLTERDTGAGEQVVIVAIDDDSIKQIGRWPWPRSVLAATLDKLSTAKVIGLQTFLTEAQQEPGLLSLQQMRGVISRARMSSSERKKILDELTRQETSLNHDFVLSDRLAAAGNVYMPMFFSVGTPLGKPTGALPEFVSRNRINNVYAQGEIFAQPYPTFSIEYPLEQFGTFSGIGHLNILQDNDGAVRSESLLLEHYGEYYPSLSLQIAARYLNLSLDDITINLNERSVQVGSLDIRTDENLRMLTGFYTGDDGKPGFPVYSLVDVLNDKLPANLFENKIVIIGPTAVGVGSSFVTPISESMQAPVLQSNIIASLLNQDFYTRPDWLWLAELLIFITVSVYLILLLPMLNAARASFVTAILFFMLIGSGLFVISNDKIWIQVVTPAMMLFVGHLLWATHRFLITERQKISIESGSAESNRMLGLSFQNQGQLDMAMDTFRKLPVDESVLEMIYNLALDFERKRQFNKAVAVYDYISRHGKGFKDVNERRKRALHIENTVVIGSGGLSGNATIVMDGMTEKPMLGRYELEKELGRGAMGTVYLAQDPGINRVVAIKTMELSNEFDASELEGAKLRFFREAETAGRLNHPNIVSIYDIGEEQDLAYIAMEFLQGKDLSYLLADSRKDLDMVWVLELIAKIADALDYAHKNGVVHRDIKPANIMFDSDTGEIKITDFGIARITASNKTKTGTILGTPSYMSPEQIMGKKIDGRSDLFSLGIMMYEMLAGEQPFSGESMAALMFGIAHATTPDINEIRTVPDCVKGIIEKVLEKEADARYVTGAEMKKSIDMCLEQIAVQSAGQSL